MGVMRYSRFFKPMVSWKPPPLTSYFQKKTEFYNLDTGLFTEPLSPDSVLRRFQESQFNHLPEYKSISFVEITKHVTLNIKVSSAAVVSEPWSLHIFQLDSKDACKN